VIELHTHTVLSDGCLVPTELIRRYEAKGFSCLVVADHVDAGTMDVVLPQLVRACSEVGRMTKVRLLPGVELTHVRPEQMAVLIERARSLGAGVVLVHGETIVEPVLPGTNRAAIECGADVLAHPGMISKAEVKLAARKGVCLEISGRVGHCLTNGHVARLAEAAGADLVYGSDTHSPDDIPEASGVADILAGAGLDRKAAARALKRAEEFFAR